MALYRIDRKTGPMSTAALDVAAARAIACAPRFPGVRWHRSYFDATAGVMTCFYDAPDVDAIRRHAEAAQLPADLVVEVVELVPPSGA